MKRKIKISLIFLCYITLNHVPAQNLLRKLLLNTLSQPSFVKFLIKHLKKPLNNNNNISLPIASSVTRSNPSNRHRRLGSMKPKNQYEHIHTRPEFTTKQRVEGGREATTPTKNILTTLQEKSPNLTRIYVSKPNTTSPLFTYKFQKYFLFYITITKKNKKSPHPSSPSTPSHLCNFLFFITIVMSPIVLTQLATGLSVLAGAVLVKSVMDQKPMAGPFPRCSSCNGTGRVSCLCSRWSDGDVGCRTCAGSGRMACSSCGGTGTGRPIPIQISARPPKRPSWGFYGGVLGGLVLPCVSQSFPPLLK